MSSNLELATELTIAWLGNSHTRANAEEVPAFLQSMKSAVDGLTTPVQPDAEPAKEYTPAVSARKSLASPDHIISMIDGKPYKTLKRHLSTNGMTPTEYRERYGLKADYPMVAPAYGEARRAMAHKIGLGRKKGETVAKSAPEGGEKPARKPRAKKAQVTA